MGFTKNFILCKRMVIRLQNERNKSNSINDKYKKIRLFNNSLLYGNPKVYLDFSLSKKIQQELGFFEKCGKMIAVIK